jgi:hypothetical protein
MSDWTCSRCGWVNRPISAQCLSCGAAADGPPSFAEIEGEPATTIETHAAPDLPRDWTATRGLLRGMAFGAVAGVAATALWYGVVAITQYEIAFVAIGVGWLVGSGAVFGARGRGSIWLAAASVGLTLAALGTSQYLIVYHWMTEEFAVALDLFQSPDLILSVIIETLQADPASLLFWGLALVYAGYIPIKAVQPVGDPVATPVPA